MWIGNMWILLLLFFVYFYESGVYFKDVISFKKTLGSDMSCCSFAFVLLPRCIFLVCLLFKHHHKSDMPCWVILLGAVLKM
jgi:hypothetical protein